jgi:drug/metabolite transporter (DMT)-like permease
VALLVFFIVLQRMEAARATSVMFTIPAVAIVIEIARGNAPGIVALVGMFVAILGVGLATAPRTGLGRPVRRASALRVRV